MSTGARFRTIPDVLRMGLAMRQPGIDPRVWATGGRIVEEGNSIRWDSDLGFVVDVNAYGGGLQGDVVVARVARNHPNEFIPLDTDCEVMIVVPEGEVDGIPVILGTINNADGCEAPGEIQGLLIDGSTEVTTIPFDLPFGVISPFDTEIKKSPHSRREEYGGNYGLKANKIFFEGDDIDLADRNATQSYVRGEDMVNAILDVLAIFPPFILDSGGLPCTLNPTWNTPGGGKDIAKAILTLALSTRIKGE